MTRRAAGAGVIAACGLAATLAGCDGADREAGAGAAALRHDLDAASDAAGFATPIRPHAATQVVSALELGAASAGPAKATRPAPSLSAPVRAAQRTPTRVIVRVRYVDAPAADAVALDAPAGASKASAETATAASGGGGTFSPGAVAGPVQGGGAGAGIDAAPGDGAGRVSGRDGSCTGHGRGGRGGFPGGSIGMPSGRSGPYRGAI